MNLEEIKELLKQLPQSVFHALKKDFEREERIRKYLAHHENIPLSSQVDKRITAPFSKAAQQVALKRCPICEIFTSLEAIEKHLEEKHSFASRDAKSINEKLKILYKEPIIWNEPLKPTKLYRTLTSKGKISCCDKFRSPEMHSIHLKKNHKNGSHQKSKVQKERRNEYDLSKLTPQELLHLIKILQQNKEE